MNKYPDDFNMEESEEKILGSLRQHIYGLYKNSLKEGKEYFVIKLSLHSKKIVKILIDELCTKFKYIGYVTENRNGEFIFPFNCIERIRIIQVPYMDTIRNEYIYPVEASCFVIALTDEQGRRLSEIDADAL